MFSFTLKFKFSILMLYVMFSLQFYSSTNYSQTCIKQPLLAPLKIGCLGQAVVL